MAKQLFIIEYESAHWCGGVSHVVVWAEDDSHATELADQYMDESMRELFSTEHEDEDFDDDDSQAHTVNSVEEFGPDHEIWQWYMDPQQRAAFYPTIGEPD